MCGPCMYFLIVPQEAIVGMNVCDTAAVEQDILHCSRCMHVVLINTVGCIECT